MALKFIEVVALVFLATLGVMPLVWLLANALEKTRLAFIGRWLGLAFSFVYAIVGTVVAIVYAPFVFGPLFNFWSELLG